jgi:predicted nucleic acid-binding protein
MPRLNNPKPDGLADAFAAALAKSKKAELVTADHEFKSVEKEIKINWLK